VSDRYEFIDAEYAGTADGGPAPAITCMCKWLGVSKSGFYEGYAKPSVLLANRSLSGMYRELATRRTR